MVCFWGSRGPTTGSAQTDGGGRSVLIWRGGVGVFCLGWAHIIQGFHPHASAHVVPRPELISQFLHCSLSTFSPTSLPIYRYVVLLCFRNFSTEGLAQCQQTGWGQGPDTLRFAVPLVSPQLGLKIALKSLQSTAPCPLITRGLRSFQRSRCIS